MEVEAIVVCRAVEFGSEIGVDCAIVEGDSEVTVKALRNNGNGLIPFAPLINDVSLFSGLFSELSYSHIRRDGNKAAHNLARLALSTLDYTTWMKDVPSRTFPFVRANLVVRFYLMNVFFLKKKKIIKISLLGLCSWFVFSHKYK